MPPTEGEWYVSPAGAMVLAHGQDGTDRVVCDLSLMRGPGEAIANGELIASAPAMYAALAGLEGLVPHFATCSLCRNGQTRLCSVAQDSIDACRNALAAARKGQEVTP